jgi:hypothetical protein
MRCWKSMDIGGRWGGEERSGEVPFCSQKAHDDTLLAREKSASRRARGWAGTNVACSKGQPLPFPLREV